MVDDIRDFAVKNRNLISFKRVSLEIPLTALFSSERAVDISIHNPKFVFEQDIFDLLDDVLKKRKPRTKRSAVKLNRLYIKNGELIYSSPKLTVELLGFNLESSLKQLHKMAYRLKSPHLKVVMPFKKKELRFEGDVESVFRQDREGWRINRFVWNTEHVKVEMNGRFFKNRGIALNATVRGSMRQVLDRILGKKLSIREDIYVTARIKKGQEKKVTVNGEFNASHFTTGGEKFENLRGNIKWDSIDRRVKIDAFFAHAHSPSLPASFKVDSIKGHAEVQIKNVPGRKLVRIINIDDVMPVAGILSESSFTIEKGVIVGTAEFDRDRNQSEEAFDLKGSVDFSYHIKKKAAEFKTTGLAAEFGRIALVGKIDPKERERVSIQGRAVLDDIAGLDKYSRFYLGLDLAPWNLEKGTGSIDLDVRKIDKNLVVTGDLLFRHFSSSKQSVQLFKGHVESEHKVTRGTFFVQDEQLKGEVGLYIDNDKTRMEFREVRGESHKALQILGFDVALWGDIAGNFSYEKRRGEEYPHVLGRCKGERLNFYGFDFVDLQTDVEAREFFALKNLRCLYKGGKGDADILIDYKNKTYRLNGAIKNIDINQMHREFAGKGTLSFAGAGAFDADPIDITFNAEDMFFYQGRTFEIKGKANILTDFSNYRLRARGDIFYKTIPSPFGIDLNQEEGRYSGSFNLGLADINLLIPWGNNRGELELKGQIFSDEKGKLSAQGYATFKGDILSFPNFPHAIKDFEGDLIFKDLDFTLRSLHGKMGGGPVESRGRLIIKNDRLQSLSVDFSGEDMVLYPMDRTSCRVDARNLALNYVGEKLLLEGDLVFSAGAWEREVDEEVSFNTDPSLSPSGSTFLELLTYDLRLIGKKNIRIENSLLKANGQFDLRLTGTPDFPILTGFVESKDGYLSIADNQFELIRARLRFNNKFRNDPVIDLEAETFLKNYRIKFSVRGSYSRLKPEFLSTPPLPPRDILTLLSLGELFEQPTTSELSSHIGEGTTGLIVQEITDQIKKRTKKIFGDYMLRIDPNITNITGASVEDTSRVIIGKSIAKNFLIVYSTNFSTQRQQVLYFQYQLAPTVSLIGMRNEEGRFSIDIRYRKRH